MLVETNFTEQLTKEGYSITSKSWNETNTKFEVIATKPEKKGGK